MFTTYVVTKCLLRFTMLLLLVYHAFTTFYSMPSTYLPNAYYILLIVTTFYYMLILCYYVLLLLFVLQRLTIFVYFLQSDSASGTRTQ